MTTRDKKRRARQRSALHGLIVKERQRRRAASLDQALGWRIDEWVALTGSLPAQRFGGITATTN